MDKAIVLNTIKETVEEIINHPLDKNYTKLNDINSNTILISHEFDEDGPINNYFRILDINDNIYLVDCKEDGIPFIRNQLSIIEMYSPLNKLTKNQIRYEIMDLDIMDARQLD